MPNTLLSEANPVLTRELRASLRNARAFALLSVYVAVLGAIVVATFPSNQEVSIELSGGSKGQELFLNFVGAQAFLVLVLFPALSSGALAQERERRTLEPLLLTPLTPLQIVWGKAAGVLSLAAVLLVSTLPLTSLAFLLGGVSPMELFGAYAGLLGLALFTTSVGLYCSARWASTTQATIACYSLLPFLLGFIVLLSGFGIIISGLLFTAIILYGVVLLWRRWSDSRLARGLGFFWQPLLWCVLLAVVFALMAILAWSWNFSVIFIVVFFITVYFAVISQRGLVEAAQEIARRPEPRAPIRERLQDWKTDWQQGLDSKNTQVVYLPDPNQVRLAPKSTFTPQSTFTPVVHETIVAEPLSEPALAPQSKPADKSQSSEPTYGVQPFLSDKLNPVFAKDMRSGLLGRFEYLFRFSYIMVIASELFLLLAVIFAPTHSAPIEHSLFVLWAKLHLSLLVVAAAWLGARSIAPEREQQTLQQLFTTPLTPATIVQGKIMAVMVYSLYIFAMGIPLVLLLVMLDIIPLAAAVYFLLAELVFGACAAAWGLLCSLQCVSVHRATGTALGGVLVALLGAPLLLGVVMPALRALPSIGPETLSRVQWTFDILLPLQALERALTPFYNQIGLSPTGSGGGGSLPFLVSIGFYGFLAALLLMWTARLFKKYAQTV